jgi:hypothetical protein
MNPPDPSVSQFRQRIHGVGFQVPGAGLLETWHLIPDTRHLVTRDHTYAEGY